MKVILENIRTFYGRHEIPLRPITLLTGENSSGKTTFLACLAAITNRTRYPLRPDFNSAPYNLGNYDTIASRFGRADTISLGWMDERRDTNRKEIATFRAVSSGIKLSDYDFSCSKGRVRLSYEESASTYAITANVPNVKKAFRHRLEKLSGLLLPFVQNFHGQLIWEIVNRDNKGVGTNFRELLALLEVESIDPTISIAPIRTRPERTYDRTSEIPAPDGSHIPFVLDKILADTTSERRRKLLASLSRFGQESGLFKKIEVRRLGKKASDPFQITANVSGKLANLTDVGYGVSQSLPVVIESVLAASNNRVLIQQPEVHLHPRAQAALGTFFVDQVTQDHKHFVIETHSDYVLDRIRQEIACGRIKCSDVSIVYFERQGGVTNVFNISLDRNGNVLNAPSSYRDFFFREEMNLLLRTSE